MKKTCKDSYGLIAQETYNWCPEAVDENKDISTGEITLHINYDVAYAKLFAALIHEIKSLKHQVQELKDVNLSNNLLK